MIKFHWGNTERLRAVMVPEHSLYISVFTAAKVGARELTRRRGQETALLSRYMRERSRPSGLREGRRVFHTCNQERF